jgi:hypothetical protein
MLPHAHQAAVPTPVVARDVGREVALVAAHELRQAQRRQEDRVDPVLVDERLARGRVAAARRAASSKL